MVFVECLLIVAVVNCWHDVVHWNVLLIVAVVDVFWCSWGVFLNGPVVSCC